MKHSANCFPLMKIRRPRNASNPALYSMSMKAVRYVFTAACFSANRFAAVLYCFWFILSWFTVFCVPFEVKIWLCILHRDGRCNRGRWICAVPWVSVRTIGCAASHMPFARCRIVHVHPAPSVVTSSCVIVPVASSPFSVWKAVMAAAVLLPVIPSAAPQS